MFGYNPVFTASLTVAPAKGLPAKISPSFKTAISNLGSLFEYGLSESNNGDWSIVNPSVHSKASTNACDTINAPQPWFICAGGIIAV